MKSANGVTFGDGTTLTYADNLTQFISVLDGMALAELCERFSVGVAKHHVHLPLPDFDVLEGLR